MKKKKYDENFEKDYDEFIHRSEIKNGHLIDIEQNEIFLHEVARWFYDRGKMFGLACALTGYGLQEEKE